MSAPLRPTPKETSRYFLWLVSPISSSLDIEGCRLGRSTATHSKHTVTCSAVAWVVIQQTVALFALILRKERTSRCADCLPPTTQYPLPDLQHQQP